MKESCNADADRRFGSAAPARAESIITTGLIAPAAAAFSSNPKSAGRLAYPAFRTIAHGRREYPAYQSAQYRMSRAQCGTS